MTKLKSLAIASAAAFSVVGIGVGISQAATPTTTTNRMSSLVTAIAQKFNLSTTDVQQVFDTQHAQAQATRQAEEQARFKTMLTQAVTKGTLTQAQADLIAAKQQEVMTFMATLKDKTPADRQAAMTTEMAAVKQWATTNNIPMAFQHFVGGMGIKGGMGGSHDDKPFGQDLTRAVTNGTLTQAQADLIKAKQTEIKAFMETLKDKTAADRQTAITTQEAAVKAWATANNIPEQFIHVGGPMGPGGRGGMGFGGGRGGMRGPGMGTNQTPPTNM